MWSDKVLGKVIAIVILLNTKHNKTRTLTLKVVNKTVTNTLHGTNFQAFNSRNRQLFVIKEVCKIISTRMQPCQPPGYMILQNI